MKYSLLLSLFICISFISLSSIAQNIDAQQAYDSAQHLRSKAVKKWGKDHATKSDIADGIAILKSALEFLQNNHINELGEGNIYLAARKEDVSIDIAKAYAIDGQNDSSICYLEKMYEGGGVTNMYFQLIQQDSAFINLQSNPRFIKLGDKFKKQEDLYRGTAFKTPYKQELTDDEKIGGLTLLWSQAKYNFVYFDRLNIDWNQSYLDYLPRIRAARTTAEYYRVLQTFYAQLKDGHTNVYLPKELNSEFNARPPLRTELIQGKVFVKSVFSDSLRKEGIVPGMEILKIDSEPVLSYAEKYVAPYLSGSTRQDLDIREFSYFLLSGSAYKPVSLELKDRNGKVFTMLISKTGYRDIKAEAAIEYQTIGNVGYLTINNFEDWKIVKQFDSLFTSIIQTKGLIIDIRNNGGGNSGIGIQILRRITDIPFTTSPAKMLKYISRPGWEVYWYNDPSEIIEPDEKRYYSKPVVLLVGARTFSAAEDFAATFKFMKRGKMIGQLTGGSTGEPVGFDLPGGGSARVCGKRETYPDGKEFVGIGIIPDIIISPSAEDLQNATDSVKNKALELINSAN
ncbi:MAG TPA: S41 family peptidase [Puia sp.]|jgi:carboxyl-terminal processing protease|nr:S41 family peptidase [Puia sp.]